MNRRHFLVVLCLTISYALQAQRTVDTTYYSDWTFYKKRNKSKYAKITINNGDFYSETQKNIRSGQLYVYKAYDGEEPVGVWKRLTSIQGLEEKDYRFDLKYTRKFPRGVKGESPIRALLFNMNHIGYKKPVTHIKGEPKDFRKVFRRTFRTPRYVRAQSYHGGYVIEVDVRFHVDKSGNISNVQVLKGQNPLVDKEIVRTLHNIGFERPAMLNGKAIATDFVYRVRMQIRPNAI